MDWFAFSQNILPIVILIHLLIVVSWDALEQLGVVWPQSTSTHQCTMKDE